jgi:hypothetical protein
VCTSRDVKRIIYKVMPSDYGSFERLAPHKQYSAKQLMQGTQSDVSAYLYEFTVKERVRDFAD